MSRGHLGSIAAAAGITAASLTSADLHSAYAQADAGLRSADAYCRRMAASSGGERFYTACMQMRGYRVQPASAAPANRPSVLTRGVAFGQPTGSAPLPSRAEGVARYGQAFSPETEAMIQQADKLVGEAWSTKDDSKRMTAIRLYGQAERAHDPRGTIGYCVQLENGDVRMADDPRFSNRRPNAATLDQKIRQCIIQSNQVYGAPPPSPVTPGDTMVADLKVKNDRDCSERYGRGSDMYMTCMGAALTPVNRAEAQQFAKAEASLPTPEAKVIAARLAAGDTLKLWCAPTDKQGVDWRGQRVVPAPADLYQMTLSAKSRLVDIQLPKQDAFSTALTGMVSNGPRGHFQQGYEAQDGVNKQMGRRDRVAFDSGVMTFGSDRIYEGRASGATASGTFTAATQQLAFKDSFDNKLGYCASTQQAALDGALLRTRK